MADRLLAQLDLTVDEAAPWPDQFRALPAGAGMQYRVVGVPAPHPRSEPAEPSLEDGYIRLVRAHRLPLAAAS